MHTFRKAAGSNRPSRKSRSFLRFGNYGPRNGIGTRHRGCGHSVQPINAYNFFDQIGFAMNVRTPGWRSYFEHVVTAAQFESEISQDHRRIRARKIKAAQTPDVG